MTDAFICDAVRTPIGRYGGALAAVRADDLAAVPLKALMARNPGVRWEEVDDCHPDDFTIATVPARFAELGDLHAGIDDAPGSLDGLLALADRDDAEGLPDAPWPPNFPTTATEERRAPPSKRRPD